MMRRQRFSAPFAEADVVPQTVEQNFVNLIGGSFPAVIKPLLVHRTVKGFGEGKVQVKFPVMLFQFGKRSLPAVRESRLLYPFPLLKSA